MQGADKGQIAVPLAVIESITDDELVRNLESDEGHVHVDLLGLGLAQQRDHVERARAA
ncbi:Uncharacterised protein [Mycobacteroides abscessus subsp. abscessus]|nr:Uncharacterised protein [Mycobacteroides abscessus subsp. abscessus]